MQPSRGAPAPETPPVMDADARAQVRHHGDTEQFREESLSSRTLLAAVQGSARGEQPASPTGAVEAGFGLAADAAAAGLRFASAERARAGRPGGTMPQLLDFLERERGLRSDVPRRLSGQEPRAGAEQLHGGWPPEPRAAQRAYVAAVDDIGYKADGQLAQLGRALGELEERDERQNAGCWARGRICCMRDFRRTQCFCLTLWLVSIMCWEIAMGTMERDRACDELDGEDGLTGCVDVRDLQQAVSPAPAPAGECDWWDRGPFFTGRRYRCAVPWVRTPRAPRCSACGCGAVCDHCTQCICLYGSAQEQHHQCRAYGHYPGEWARVVRWTLVSLGALAYLVFGAKVLLSSRFWEARSSQDREMDKALREHQRLVTDIELLKRDLRRARLGSDAWKEEEPDAAFLRRMKDRLGDYDYYRLHSHLGGGEPTRPHASTAGEELADSAARTAEEILNLDAHQDAARRKRWERAKGPGRSRGDVRLDAARAEAATVYQRAAARSAQGVPTREALAAAAGETLQPDGATLVRRLLAPEDLPAAQPLTLEQFQREFVAMLPTLRQVQGSPRRTRRKREQQGSGPPSAHSSPPPQREAPTARGRLSDLIGVARKAMAGPDEDAESDWSSESYSSSSVSSANTAGLAARAVPHVISMALGRPVPSPNAARQQSAAVRQMLMLLQGGIAHDSPDRASRASPPRQAGGLAPGGAAVGVLPLGAPPGSPPPRGPAAFEN
eukprot:TRINITY_DN28209_c0_g1_i1.p1 TRINITY_DN28209_c0_g1~~TRINITY_DN28209_c0_g1_i1.p1  ORF type:complete len:754 (+),score=240.75 TRINITY_DN28209_c0_g1_i1:83-2263(+)